MQEIRSALNVLLKMLCLSQNKQLLFRSFFIISRKFHYFSMRCEILMTRTLDNVNFRWRKLSMTQAFDDASSRWRELSIASISVASLFDLETNKVFVTLLFSLDNQIFWFNSYFTYFNQCDLDLLEYLS